MQHACEKYQSPSIHMLQPRLKFFLSRSNTKVKVTKSNLLAPMERFVTRNTHVKYQSPSTYYTKVVAKVKGFSKKVEYQDQDHNVRCFGRFHREHSCKMSKPQSIPFKRSGQGSNVQLVGQTPRSRSQGQICWYPWKGLITRNTHVKYQHHSSRPSSGPIFPIIPIISLYI